MGASKGLSGSGAHSLQWLARGHQGEKTGKFPSDLGDGSEALSTPGESDGRLGGRL